MADRAGSPHEVRRVRIRPGAGPRAATTGRRLARIAGQHLGPALDRALADVEQDVDVERVTITFPAEPDELDDEALAMLWASLVRDSLSALLDAPGQGPPQAASEPTGDALPLEPTVRPSDPTELVAIVSALERWVHDGTPPTQAEVVLALSHPELAERALAGLPEPWPALARELLARAAGPAAAPAPSTSVSSPADGGVSGPPDTAATEVRSGSTTRGVVEPVIPVADVPLGVYPTSPAKGREAADRPALREPAGSGLGVTSWGGLVLLHYRLRPYLEAATSAEPEVDPVAVRGAALALVVDDPKATADPLVALLAGRADWVVPEETEPVAWQDAAGAVARADQLLEAFAGDLRGFGASSPVFVRQQWLRRRALLLEDVPAVLLTLERRPLDLVLDGLPYPVGALRLPWTPPLFVGWERP